MVLSCGRKEGREGEKKEAEGSREGGKEREEDDSQIRCRDRVTTWFVTQILKHIQNLQHQFPTPSLPEQYIGGL